MAKTATRTDDKRALEFLEKNSLEPFRLNDLAEAISGPQKSASASGPVQRHRNRVMGPAASRAATRIIQGWREQGLVVKAGSMYWRGTKGMPAGTDVNAQPYVRKTVGGRVMPEQKANVVLKVTTRVPQKWAMVDLETGEVYQGSADGLVRLDPDYVQDLRDVVAKL